MAIHNFQKMPTITSTTLTRYHRAFSPTILLPSTPGHPALTKALMDEYDRRMKSRATPTPSRKRNEIIPSSPPLPHPTELNSKYKNYTRKQLILFKSPTPYGEYVARIIDNPYNTSVPVSPEPGSPEEDWYVFYRWRIYHAIRLQRANPSMEFDNALLMPGTIYHPYLSGPYEHIYKTTTYKKFTHEQKVQYRLEKRRKLDLAIAEELRLRKNSRELAKSNQDNARGTIKSGSDKAEESRLRKMHGIAKDITR